MQFKSTELQACTMPSDTHATSKSIHLMLVLELVKGTMTCIVVFEAPYHQPAADVSSDISNLYIFTSDSLQSFSFASQSLPFNAHLIPWLSCCGLSLQNLTAGHALCASSICSARIPLSISTGLSPS